MIPKTDFDLRQDFVLSERQTSKTYRMNIEKEHVRGRTDMLEAMKQAVFKILNTERYDHLIYSWNYGVEFSDLIGESTTYAIPEIKRRIEEALTQDDRITGADAFSFQTEKGKVLTQFTVHTVFGDVEAGKEVEV